jgi:hypothetical protein
MIPRGAGRLGWEKWLLAVPVIVALALYAFG